MRIKNRAPLALWARRERFCDPFTGGRGLSELSQGSAETVYLLIHVVMDTKIIRRNAEIQNYLEAKAQGDDIASCVAQEVIDHSYADPCGFFRDLFRHGCASGMI